MSQCKKINYLEVNYGATKNTYDEKTEHKESYVINKLTVTKQVYNGVEAATKGNGTI